MVWGLPEGIAAFGASSKSTKAFYNSILLNFRVLGQRKAVTRLLIGKPETLKPDSRDPSLRRDNTQLQTVNLSTTIPPSVFRPSELSHHKFFGYDLGLVETGLVEPTDE